MRKFEALKTYAELAWAGYKGFIKLGKSGRFDTTSAQRDNFSKDFVEIKSSEEDNLSGFQAVLYKNIKTGEYILSVRGTEINQGFGQAIKDLLADIELAFNGTPHSQIGDMVKFINELKKGTKGNDGKTAVQINNFDNITIVGHSLGGTLAQIASKIYPGLFDNCYTFNSPSGKNLYLYSKEVLKDAEGKYFWIVDVQTNYKYYLDDAIGEALYNYQKSPMTTSVTDIRAKDFFNLIADLHENDRFGELIEVSGETHFIAPMTKILYFYDFAISHGISEEFVTNYLSSYYKNIVSSMTGEGIANIAEKIIQDIDKTIGKAQGKSDIIDICQIYDSDKTNFTLELIPFNAPINQIFPDSNISIEKLYALVNLNNFIISDIDLPAYKELEKYKDEYSDNYVKDKSKMLQKVLISKAVSGEYYKDYQSNIELKPLFDESGQVTDSPNNQFIFGTNKNDDIENIKSKLNPDTHTKIYALAGDDNIKIVGGSAYIEAGSGNDTIDLRGSKGENTVYGGVNNDKEDKNYDDGDDTIYGGEGKDTIYGGSGKDTIYTDNDDKEDLLYGGDGFDTYYAGDKDIIEDTDGQGRVFFNDSILTGGTYDKEKGVYLSEDGKTEYKLLEDGKLIVKKDGGTVTINGYKKDFKDENGNAYLSITLLDADEIGISISDNQTNEGDSGKKSLDFNISLQGSIEKGEFLILGIGDKKYLFGDPSEEYIKKYNLNLAQYERGNTYTYTWDSNTDKQEDRKFDVTPTIIQTSDKLKAKVLKHGIGKIIDDDRDPNEDLPETYDPIVIDFNKNGVTSTRLDNTVYFDHDNNGFAEATAWVEKDDGLLALDKNNNGKIDNGNELFGNHTISNTAYGYTDKKATNGYEALKAYDLNGDNAIDEKDEIFDKLKIWKDKNSNGITDEGELSSLADNNIKSIDLNYKEIAIDENSNTVKQSSKVTLKDGSTLDANDVWMKVNLNKTEEIIDQSKLSPEAQALPQVMASGNLNSLRVAAGKNEKLATMINLYLMLSPEDRKKHIDELIYEWAGVSDMDPNSRTTSIDSRIVNVYEKLTGKPFTWHGRSNDANISISANIIKERFDTFKRYVYAAIELQTTYSDMNLNLDLMNLREDGKLSYKFDALNSKLMQLYKDEKYNEIVKLIDNVRDTSAYKPIFQENLKENLSNFCVNDDKLLSLCFNTYISGTDGNDVISGNSEDNFIVGGKGKDTINGGAGDDTYVFARGDGNDIIYDTMGNDKIQFREGITHNDVRLKRELDKLIISIKNNNDSITIQNFFSVNPEIGNNTIRTITFADGTVYDLNKILELTPLSSTDKDDKLYLTDGNDTFDGGLGNDEIWGGNGDDIINGGEGDDTLYGNDGNDTIIGGKGNDTLNGGYGNDTYIFNKGDGVDTIIDYGGNNILKLGAGLDKKDLIVSHNSNGHILLSFKNNASDSITLTSPNIQVVEFANGDKMGIDEIKKLSLIGDDTDNTIYGYNGENNILVGNKGNDTLTGSYGNDTYIFNKGDGNDIIADTGGINTLQFGEGISRSDLEFNAINFGSDLKISFKSTPHDSVIINRISIKNIKFANGKILKLSDIDNIKIMGTEGNDVIRAGINTPHIIEGGNGNDNIKGNNYTKSINGGKGNDWLNGGEGNDTYIFNEGDGSDVIYDTSGIDTLKFGINIRKEDLKFKRDPNKLVISVKEDSGMLRDSITLENFYSINSGITHNNTVRTISFADGSVYNLDDMLKSALPSPTDRADILYLSDGDDTFDAGLGNDIIWGGDGDDVIYGNEGNDTIYGDNGNDTLIGGKGDDKLEGRRGDDTYIFNKGDGNDVIYDIEGSNTIKFNDFSADDINIKRIFNDVVINSKISNDTVTLQRFYNNNGESTINTIKFKDGTSWDYQTILNNSSIKATEEDDKFFLDDQDNEFNALGGDDKIYGNWKSNIIDGGEGNDILIGGQGNDTLIGGSGNDELYGGEDNDILIGGTGNDMLIGGAGNDTYIFNKGDGNDTVEDYTGNNTIKFNDFTLNDIDIKKVFDDIVISSKISNDTITIKNKLFRHAIENIVFKDGSVLSHQDILNRSSIKATEGSDKFYLSDKDDEFDALGGDDEIYGQDGNDVINGNKGNDKLYGGKGNDTLNGGSGYDLLDGGEGNDILIGGKNDDTLNGGYGDDTYIFNKGDGNDTITDNQGTDTIKFGEGINREDLIVKRVARMNDRTGRKEYSDIVIFFKNSSNDSITMQNVIDSNKNRDNNIIENFEFANGEKLSFEDIKKLSLIGTDNNENIVGYVHANNIIKGEGGDDKLYGQGWNDTMYGGDGNDLIEGGSGNDTLIGDKGDDTLNGSVGNDTYVFNKGDGNDTIEDSDGADAIKFGEGIGKEDLLISRGADKDDIVIKFKNNTADSITLKNVIYENKTRINGAIENFEFANGDKLSFKDIKELPMVGTDSGEAVKGFDDANNTLVGSDGNDKLYGGDGNDTLMGGDGEDELHGGMGDNTFIGGKGNDIIEGGNGNDTYIFNKGDGTDTIKENGNMSDVLKFGKGISKEDLIVTRGSYYGDITIKFKNNDTDSIILKDAIVRGSAVNGGNIDYFEFENGDKLELDDIKRLSLLGTDQNDKLSAYHDMDNNIIKGFGGDDVIEGAGTDVLGRGLKDTIYGGEGNDSISGYGGDDVLYGEEGNDSIDGGDGNDIIVGGKGDDILDGGDGDDTYVFNIGDGADIIEESGGGMDIIKFGEGINKEDIIISKSKREEGDREPTCLTIKFKNNDKDSITLQSVIRDNKPSPYYAGAKASQFANGDKLSFEDIIALSLVGTDKNETIRGYSDANNTIVGNGGNDELYGDRGDDTLVGGTGDDILNGGAGNDTFVFNKGDGNDTIADDYIKYSNDKDSDTLKFGEGISKENLIAKRVRNDYPNDNYRNYRDIVISLKNSTGDSITLRNATDQNRTNENNAVKTFKFANGEELGIEEIKRLSLIGTDADDDTLYGYNDMDNIIKGGNGNDTLTGGGGVENILEGGRGNDILKGGYRSYGEEIRGKNTFVFSKGDGKDTITSINNGDLIKFKDLNKEDVKFELDLVNKTLLISSTVSNDTVLVEGYSATSEEYDHINQRNIVNDINIEFKDGKILGSDFINKQVKPIGDANTMVGGSENNTFEYEGGLKSIVDIGGYDKVIFKKPGNRIYYSSDGVNLKISTAPIDANNKDVLEVKGFFSDKNSIVEEFQINSYWNIKAQDIYQAFGKTYIGDEKPAQPNDPGKPDTPSDNTIIGGSGNDTFSYEGGLKSIKDSGGYDKVIFKKEGNHVYYQMFGEDLKISTAPINENNKDVLEVKGFFGNKNNIVEEFQINSYWNIKAQDIYKAFGKTYIASAKPTALAMNAKLDIDNETQISPLSKSSSDGSNSKSGWDMVLGGGDKSELKAIVSEFYNDTDLSTSKLNSALSPSGIADINTISGISQEEALKDSAFLSQDTVNKIIEQLNVYADNSEALEFNQKDIRKDDMQVYMS